MARFKLDRFENGAIRIDSLDQSYPIWDAEDDSSIWVRLENIPELRAVLDEIEAHAKGEEA